jgi:hypothetical protein
MRDISIDFWLSDSIPMAPVCDSDVHKTIKPLSPSKSVRIDGDHVFIVKGCSDILMSVLKFVFNLSSSQPIFPSLSKPITVVPNFKNGRLP